MGIGFTDSQNYANIADAIRYKSGGSNTYTPANMAAAIRAIPGGGGTPTLQDKTVTPSTAPQTVGYDSGYDGLNTVTVLGDDNLVAGNIKKNVQIFGTTGSYIGTTSEFVIRPNAELVKTFTYDQWIIADEVISSFPAYSTSVNTLIASTNYTAFALDLTSYDYFITVKGLAIPSYTDSVKLKGLEEYSITAACYEITNTPGNSWYFLNGSAAYPSRNDTVYATGAIYKALYFTSATSYTIYSASTYGIAQVGTAPSISSATTGTPNLTVKTPTLQIRGSATYFASGAWSKLSDIRRQFKIDVYRSAKGELNYDGWMGTQQITHILNDAHSNTHTLT